MAVDGLIRRMGHTLPRLESFSLETGTKSSRNLRRGEEKLQLASDEMNKSKTQAQPKHTHTQKKEEKKRDNNATYRHHFQSRATAAAETAQPQQALLRQCQLIVTAFSRPEQISLGSMATCD